MTLLCTIVADDDNYYEFAAAHGLKPAAEQTCIGQMNAASHLIRTGKRFRDTASMLGQQVRVPFGDV